MLTAFLEFKEAIRYIARNTNHSEFKKLELSNLDWYSLQELKKIFEIFVKPSVNLQGEVYTTISQGLLYVYQVWKNLRNLGHDYMRQIQEGSVIVSYFLFFFF